MLARNHILGEQRTIQHHSVQKEITKNTKMCKKRFYQIRVVSCHKKVDFHFFFFKFFLTSNPDRVSEKSMLVGIPLLISFHLTVYFFVETKMGTNYIFLNIFEDFPIFLSKKIPRFFDKNIGKSSDK